jgi:pimeloyl-ACP methyl ester carboxylesterase
MVLPRTEHGDGPPVLLLHAGIANRQMWDEHLEPLAANGYRVVALDLPGFGEARGGSAPTAHWDDVVETMAALEIERAALVGNSFGGAVALRVAALHPERVAALVLFSAPGVPEPDPSAELLAAWGAEEDALAAGDVERAVEATVSAWVGPHASDEMRHRIASMQRRNYEGRMGQEITFATDLLETDPGLLKHVSCPALLAVGEDDLPDYRAAVSDLAEKLPQATSTASIPRCGHLAPLEAPEEFRRLLVEYLAAEAIPTE